MIDFIVVTTTLYFFYQGYLWLRKRIDDEERKHNEIIRLSEDEHDISDWGFDGFKYKRISLAKKKRRKCAKAFTTKKKSNSSRRKMETRNSRRV